MTTQPVPPLDTPAHAARLPVPAAERGATVIPDKVVARIAARAAREALTGRTGTAPARLGLAPPRATVAVSSGAARLQLSLDLPYPVDIAEASRLVQNHVGERVAQLTGLRVTEVTLTIQHLVPSSGLEHRRVH
ncbi:Asp23/Gls24 family envelope stress response protein [Streptomyces sp. ISL-43]|uniref:Asp23/Gls24 family envelope stress response protein n=1 Tax=Streptomyces sp. ISL-43 TaxID=2819183 RepID=UPI001BEAAE68|nr:Asp23/Gls24 family envelope stress response protein [Streptomyces sp. ISL-43]MBT2452522.1 Asp23/Gls24 family envelope stress response protein [Streptomyces sp. ISL-43]